jgi:hypothetical protein
MAFRSRQERVKAHLDKAERLNRLADHYSLMGLRPLVEFRRRQSRRYRSKAFYWSVKPRKWDEAI